MPTMYRRSLLPLAAGVLAAPAAFAWPDQPVRIVVPFTPGTGPDIVARFAVSLPTPSLVLDVGCGPGRDLARFAAHGHVARGIELNPEFVARARCHAPTMSGDVRDVAAHYPHEFFDGIWASASLVHLPASEMDDVLGQ